MSTMLGEYVSTSEAAGILHVSPGRVRQFVVEERLFPKKIGTVLFFKLKDIKEFAKQKRDPGRPKSPRLKKAS